MGATENPVDSETLERAFAKQILIAMGATPPPLTPFPSISFSTGTTCHRHNPEKAQQIKAEKLETALRDETAWMEHWENKVAGIFAEFRAWCERYDRGEPAPDKLPSFSRDGFDPAFYIVDCPR